MVCLILLFIFTNYRFRDKYHPDYIVSKEKQRAALMARFNVFRKMRDEGFYKGISLEYKERAAITKLLDQC